MRTHGWIRLALAIGLLAGGPVARAALGGPADSVESDRASLSAARKRVLPRSGYVVHVLDSGAAEIREYVSASGIVFGIAWNGVAHPDLGVLLGSYSGDYEAGLERSPRKPGRRSHHSVRTDRLVVEKSGHMRDLRGRAYSPALLPPGVSADEIR